MIRKVLILSLSTALVTTAHIESTYSNDYRGNSSKDLYEVIASALGVMESIKERYQSTDSDYYPSPRSISGFRREKSEDTEVQARSYYGGTSPAFYPAFDPISILASLAFLAFLLQSFAALFDRSRSIIPAVISSRDSAAEVVPPDPIELILLALDEYEVLNNDISDEEKSVKKIIKTR